MQSFLRVFFYMTLLVVGGLEAKGATTKQKEADKSAKKQYKHKDFKSFFNVDYYPGLYIPEQYDFAVNPDVVAKNRKYKKHKKYYDDLAERYGAELAANKCAELSVRFVSDKVGHGLFADKDIKKGELIGEYTGKLIVKTQKDVGNAYLFIYPGVYRDAEGNKVRFRIDAKKQGNALRFANHSDDNTNAEVIEIPYKGRWYVAYRASKKIRKDTQILVSYGPYYWKTRGKPEVLKP